MSHIFPHDIENQINLNDNQTLLENDPVKFRFYSEASACLFRSFCSDLLYLNCYNTTLATCNQCSYAGFVTFGVVMGLLGLGVVITNSLVLLQVVWKKNKGAYDKIKASLAVADILTGFQALVIVPYNLHWTIHSTPSELLQTILGTFGSPQAIAGGIFYMFGFSSSLYHLVFLSQQRVFAMRWPLKYRVQEARTVHIGLGIVWFLAILTAVAPAWFPEKVIFTYSPETFIFLYISNFAAIATDIIIGFVLPFLMMTCFMIYSAVLIKRNVKRTKRLSGRNENQAAHNKREASMLKTVAFMQAGFTITLLPTAIFLLVVMFVFIARSSCKVYSISLQICYCLSVSNSLVNPIVYSIRDKDFRESIFQCFTSKKRLVNVLDRRIIINRSQVLGANRSDGTKVT